MSSLMMILAQWAIVAVLLSRDMFMSGAVIFALSLCQLPLMQRFIKNPIPKAIYVSAFGVPMYVAGMMVSAFALASM